MFSKLAVIFVSIVAAAAASTTTTAAHAQVTTTGNVCNIGVLECCDSIQPPQSADVQKILRLLLLGPEYTGPGFVGLQCTPVRDTANGPRFGCNNNLACCEKSEKNGVIALGCTSTNVRV